MHQDAAAVERLFPRIQRHPSPCLDVGCESDGAVGYCGSLYELPDRSDDACYGLVLAGNIAFEFFEFGEVVASSDYLGPFVLGKLKREIQRESPGVTFDLLVKPFGRYVIQLGQIDIELQGTRPTTMSMSQVRA